MKYGHFTLLPEQAFLKVGGRIKPQGGGSGASSAPTSQTVTSTSIPEYARPYAESMLGQTSALTNINNNPYQPYQGQQVAGFSPLQNQGFTSLADMQVAPQIAMGTNLANRASEGALGTAAPAMGYGAQGVGIGQQGIGIGQLGMGAGMAYGQQATDPNAVARYMNPYLQNVLQPAQQLLNQQYGMQSAAEQGAATSKGAFGGSRQALMSGLNEQNRNLAQNQLVSGAYNQAYNTANQNMQAASQLGMQGAGVGLQGISAGLQGINTGLQGISGAQNAYGLGLQGANTLGSLGTAQYNQQMGIAQAQLAAGAQQQGQQQQLLNVPYQQYQEQLNYPYKQLAFQSDMMRGLPLSQSAQTIYQNTGNMVPQVLGAGIAAYGASAGRGAKEGGLMSYARGGEVKGYALGGQPAVDPRALSMVNSAALPSKLSRLSDDQLMAYARTVKDPNARQEVQTELNRRAEMRQSHQATQAQAQEQQGGIAEQPVMAAAGGGIVALADGSEKPVKDDLGSEDDLDRAFATSMSPPSERKPRSRPLSTFSVSDKELNEPSVTYTPTSEIKIPAPENAPNLSNWEAQQQEAAQNVTLNAERQAMAQEQQNRADTVAQMYAGNAQEGPGQYPNLGGITAVPRVTGATPVATGAPAGGGIIPAVPSAPATTPAGGAPAGGINAITPRTTGAGGQGTTIGATGAGVPVGVPGDPMNFATYRANVEDMAKLDPEDKATLANMQARAEKRLRRAEGQEKNVMNDAFVAGGLAMMGGLNLADGIRRAAEQGGKQYFSSQAEARKAIDKAEEAQDAFYQYRTALKQGNKKLANEMYGTFHKSYADYISRITSAGITAGAQDRSTQENIKARELAQANTLADRQLARDQQMLIHQQNIQVHKDDVLARIANTQNVKAQTLMAGYETKLSTIQEGIRKTTADLGRTFKAQREELQFSTDKPEVKAAKLKALELRQAAALKEAVDPYVDQQARVLSMQDNLMNKILNPGGGNAGGSGVSPFKVTEVK